MYNHIHIFRSLRLKKSHEKECNAKDDNITDLHE